MSLQSRTREFRRLALFGFGAAGMASLASAQGTFSIDWHSPTVGVPDSITGTPITEGDILVPAGFVPAFGPLPPPGIYITGGPGGLGLFGHPPCVGHVGGTPCRIEVDALSYGTDYTMDPSTAAMPGNYLFSTDEFAVAGVPPILFPSINSEAPVGDSSADVWIDGGGLPPGPLPPFAAPVSHIAFLDGDGMASGSGAVYPGTGLIEPNFPGFPNAGDNLDAFDWNQNGPSNVFPPTGVYFSLDAAFPDPFGPPNTGSALAHGFTGADILWTPVAGAAPGLWAPGPALGLNLINMQEDDLDALALWENGSGAFEPSLQPYDWMTGATDMVLFSVRRGSPVVGMPDSIFGIPISEGDILTTPLPTFLGGVSPFPGIFVAAENIGLSAIRSGNFPDDLNALDTLRPNFIDCNGNGVDDALDISGGTSLDCNLNGIPDECEPDCDGDGIPDDCEADCDGNGIPDDCEPFVDCNGNGVLDACDIASGASSDINGNGVPDECEIVGGPYCFCPNAVAPCGNPDSTAGCANSTGVGGLLTATGTGSVAADNLVLTASQLPPSVFGIFFGGPTMVGPFTFGDGLRCVGGGITRFTSPTNSGPGGTLTVGPGMAGTFGFLPFSTMNFQCWYRNPTGPCGSGFNTTNAFGLTFTP